MENPTQSDTFEPEKPKRTTKAQKKKMMLKVLENQMGNVTFSCKQLGIHRDTHYQWMNEDKKYKKDVEDIVFNLKDFLENALFKLVKEGNPMVVWNANKTKNRDRGYGEHLDIEHSGEQKFIFQEIVLSDEDIKQMKNDKANDSKQKTA